ncbi:phenylalanine-4-hydroxylase-like isoform X2 [Halichondria panicea]|uniref:phenylalanine-4-hydroxylase-like isoform X2 n=1 Tax=Halichondria panicea TaxID=6063 RepID=UPI00312BBEC0
MEPRSYSLIITISKRIDSLVSVLGVLKNHDAVITHLESRPSRTPTDEDNEIDYFIQFSVLSDFSPDTFVAILQEFVVSASLVSGSEPSSCLSDSTPWFPRSIADVAQCCTTLFKYGSELTPDHPGYGDKEYQVRRKEIAVIAKRYQYGRPIPRMEYTAKEIETWGKIFSSQVKLYPTHACKEYNKHFPSLFSECGYREDNIPQLEDVSRYLKAKTDWQLWPVIGWISARDFLNSLAFRVFPTTQYIRHHSKPFYTPEPDICHELIGHAPLFCDSAFAQFSQEIGLASLAISDEWIDNLASLYWFTVEFGLVNEGGSPKAYGAGLLSGNEELQYCITDCPERRLLDIGEIIVTKYPETGLQPLYFVASSLEDMRDQMSAFSKSIPRPFCVIYDHINQKVEVQTAVV